MGWSQLVEKCGDCLVGIENSGGAALYEGDGAADRSFNVISEMDLLLRKIFDRAPTREEWIHFLKFRTRRERRKLILCEDPRFLPVWLAIHDTHAYEDGLWWGNFDRGIDPVEWEHMYKPPGRPVNAWVELAIGIAVQSHTAVMALPMDILQDLCLLDQRRRNSGIDALLAAGKRVSFSCGESRDTEGKVESLVGIPAPTPEAELEFRDLVLEIFAPNQVNG